MQYGISMDSAGRKGHEAGESGMQHLQERGKQERGENYGNGQDALHACQSSNLCPLRVFAREHSYRKPIEQNTVSKIIGLHGLPAHLSTEE